MKLIKENCKNQLIKVNIKLTDKFDNYSKMMNSKLDE